MDQGSRMSDAVAEVGKRWILSGFLLFCLWLSLRYCLLLSESLQLKLKAKRARNESRELLWDQIALEESIKETTRLCGEASMKICVPSSLR